MAGMLMRFRPREPTRIGVSAIHMTSMTCAVDKLAHLVTDDAHAAGLAAGTGLYSALCGHRVAAAPLICPPGPPCPRCAVHSRRCRLPSGRHRPGAGAC